METQELHRGRLIDHIQLVVRDLAASQAFYTAALGALKVPMGGADAGYFWADELFVSSADSPAAQGHLTGRTPLPPRLLRRVCAGPGWEQHRGGVPWRRAAQCGVGEDHVLRGGSARL